MEMNAIERLIIAVLAWIGLAELITGLVTGWNLAWIIFVASIAGLLLGIIGLSILILITIFWVFG
jgi:hypothetical protein